MNLPEMGTLCARPDCGHFASMHWFSGRHQCTKLGCACRAFLMPKPTAGKRVAKVAK